MSESNQFGTLRAGGVSWSDADAPGCRRSFSAHCRQGLGCDERCWLARAALLATEGPRRALLWALSFQRSGLITRCHLSAVHAG